MLSFELTFLLRCISQSLKSLIHLFTQLELRVVRATNQVIIAAAWLSSPRHFMVSLVLLLRWSFALFIFEKLYELLTFILAVAVLLAKSTIERKFWLSILLATIPAVTRQFTLSAPMLVISSLGHWINAQLISLLLPMLIDSFPHFRDDLILILVPISKLCIFCLLIKDNSHVSGISQSILFSSGSLI